MLRETTYLYVGRFFDHWVAHHGRLDNEFLPMNELRLDKKLPGSLQALFRIYTRLFKHTNRSKFMEWVKELVPELLDNKQRKNLPLSAQNFEEWGYSSNSNVDEEVYLALFLATWLCSRAFNDSSTSVLPETFPSRWIEERGKA